MVNTLGYEFYKKKDELEVLAGATIMGGGVLEKSESSFKKGTL